MGMKLADEQEVVMDLADLIAETYISESLYLRTEKIAAENKDNKEHEIKKSILDLHLYMSIQKVQTKAYTIIDSLPKNTKQNFLKWATRLLTKQIAINPTVLRRNIALYFIEKGGYTW